MADLTSAGVSVSRTMSETRSNGLTLFEKACTVTLATNGTMTAGEKIPASAFGLSSLEEVSAFVKSDNTEVLAAGISNDRGNVLLKAAGSNAPAAYSGAYTCVVRGY